MGKYSRRGSRIVNVFKRNWIVIIVFVSESREGKWKGKYLGKGMVLFIGLGFGRVGVLGTYFAIYGEVVYISVICELGYSLMLVVFCFFKFLVWIFFS